MQFTREFLTKDLGLPYRDEIIAYDEIVGHSRWAVQHELIFAHDGKFYRTHYQRGATESQDDRPWEYEPTVECEEVHQVEKLVKVWEKV